MTDKPKVGLGVIIQKENRVLLLKRKGSHGAGDWSFPGGHLEYRETFEECAIRELEEEIGFKPDNIRLISPYPVAVTNDFFKEENKHYITLFMKANYISGKPVNREPEKCESLDWFGWNSLLKMSLFLPVRNLIKQRYNFLD